MQSLPLSHQSVALAQPTYSFSIPTAYLHEPRRPPVPITAPVPASMDPGLDQALRRDSQRIADMGRRVSAPTAALPYCDTRGLPTAQPSPNVPTCTRPPARQGPTQIGKDKYALASSKSVATQSRQSASSTDSKARPQSAASCVSARSSAPTSIRNSPGPYKERLGGRKPQDDSSINHAEAGCSDGDTNSRLATASTVRSTVSYSAAGASTNQSGPSRFDPRTSGKALCPVHGTRPLGTRQSYQSLADLLLPATASKQDTLDSSVAAKSCLPFDQPAPPHLTKFNELRTEGNSREAARNLKSAKTASFVPKQKVQASTKESNVVTAQLTAPTATSAADTTIMNDAERHYALLQAMHAAEVTHLHPDTSYFTAKNGCETIFMPRPSLNHSTSESAGTTGCIAFPRECHETINPAQVGEMDSGKEQPRAGTRRTFERNRRLTHCGSVHKATMEDALKSHPLPCTAHPPSLRGSASLLDLTKVVRNVPGQTLQRFPPKPVPSCSDTVRGTFAGATPSAVASIGRTKSEGNLRRLAEGQSHRNTLVPLRSTVRIASAVEDADDVSMPFDPSEVVRRGSEFEAERLAWRRDFERSIEGKIIAGCAPFVRTRCRSKPRSREAVLEAGPHHSHFSIRRSKKESLQPDSVVPPRSSEARGLAAGDTSTRGSHNAADKHRTMGTKRIDTAPEKSHGKLPDSRRRFPGGTSTNLAADQTASPRYPGRQAGGLPAPEKVTRALARSSSQSSTALGQALAPPQRPSILRQISIPRKAPPARPSSTAGEIIAFDLAAAGDHSKRVTARFSSKGTAERIGSSISSQSADSEELVLIGRPSQCADVEFLDSDAPAEKWHTQSLGSHDGSESMLALEAETMLLQQGTTVSERLTVDEVSTSGGSLATARMGSSSSRRTIVPSPPPRPHPDEPLPSIPTRLSSAPQEAFDSSEALAGRADASRKSCEVRSTARASRSIGRPDSLLEPLYDGPTTPAQSAPPQDLPPVIGEF
ncbi:hypothetical protein BCV69DRAFT_23007 [Microstroma glucosiphilum]|uniref:Uncharacterized protein n=1 Tax=Pseudomicrostroma glucosiphilum TaxID=1684307 RepID=A0A316UH09_9BASI|nr:hypothetical protein BCV69DRAFT_23007 [Pseudomicrostroma glucosiphilum]PWN24208.1 hypothetical protein BCV69DRAFT_23007 [Pseudomicrostroma glucosiphilum]